MNFIKRITPAQAVFIVSVLAFVVAAFLIASQSYFSYVGVTQAANNCFDIGGYPIIEKSGFEMTYFECVAY